MKKWLVYLTILGLTILVWKPTLVLAKEMTDFDLGTPLNRMMLTAVERGVSKDLLVSLLFFPMVAAVIALARQVVGLGGFGIFATALMAWAFVPTGVVGGIILFLVILLTALLARQVVAKLKLPYLPRMAILVWLVTGGVLGLVLALSSLDWRVLMRLGIYPVLLFVLLMESFVETQITRTWQSAVIMTLETVLVALVAYFLMSWGWLRAWIWMNPEVWMLMVFGIDYGIGRYTGLRLLEVWRFRKIIKKN